MSREIIRVEPYSTYLERWNAPTAAVARGAGLVFPSLSTSGETLTIEESMTLRARTETAGHVGDEHEWCQARG